MFKTKKHHQIPDKLAVIAITKVLKKKKETSILVLLSKANKQLRNIGIAAKYTGYPELYTAIDVLSQKGEIRRTYNNNYLLN